MDHGDSSSSSSFELSPVLIEELVSEALEQSQRECLLLDQLKQAIKARNLNEIVRLSSELTGQEGFIVD